MTALLSSVSTRTLLNCLATFHSGNQDADLILATLIDRLAVDETGPDPAHDPVSPR